MPALHRRLALRFLLWLRQTPLRPLILRFLIWLHNTSYHQISFFSSYKGVHPKHAIQQYHRFFLEHIKSKDSVLDVGCGSGHVAFAVAAKARQVVGIDIRPANVARAKATYQRRNLSFIEGDATTFAFSTSFDIIVLSNVLEHIEDRVTFLQRLTTVAPTILIRVPMLTRDWISVFKKQQGFEYRLDNTHFVEYTNEIFRTEMEGANLDIIHQHVNFGELYAVVRAQ